MEISLQNEIQFYQDGNVTVTQSRYIANSTTYAVRNISSVQLYKIVKSRTIPVIMLIIGFLMLSGVNVRVTGVILIIVAVILLVNTKDEFAVRISTNAGETNTFVSKNREHVQKIVDALNDAIING
ncbi:MAG TPA: DUF6232 family protein [Pseudosphingobacterium sp.]|nr:DUF6232 family protein [Pseudosphingobacterium sp.]